MDLDTLLKICYIIVPTALAVIAFLIRAPLNRLAALEEKVIDFTTKEELRLALQDRIEPIKEDLIEIKQQLNKLYDLLLSSNK